MFYDNYSVRVIGGKEFDGYIHMPHGQSYEIALSNKNNSKCDAELSIDGKLIDIWRIPAKGTIKVSGPTESVGSFTFYKENSVEADESEVESIEKEFRGLIQVKFIPEIKKPERSLTRTVAPPWWNDGKIPEFYSPIHVPINWQIPDHLRQETIGIGQLRNTTGINEERFGITCSTSNCNEADKNLSSGITGLSGDNQQDFKFASNISLDHENSVMISVRLIHDGNLNKDESIRGNRVPPPLI